MFDKNKLQKITDIKNIEVGDWVYQKFDLCDGYVKHYIYKIKNIDDDNIMYDELVFSGYPEQLTNHCWNNLSKEKEYWVGPGYPCYKLIRCDKLIEIV